MGARVGTRSATTPILAMAVRQTGEVQRVATQHGIPFGVAMVTISGYTGPANLWRGSRLTAAGIRLIANLKDK